MDSKDMFDKDFFVQKEQEPWFSEKQKGNYTPDPVFKKLYVIVAGQAYDPVFELLFATTDKHEATKLQKSAEYALNQHDAAIDALRKISMFDDAAREKLNELLKQRLNELGLEAALKVAESCELYFVVKEVTAKVS